MVELKDHWKWFSRSTVGYRVVSRTRSRLYTVPSESHISPFTSCPCSPNFLRIVVLSCLYPLVSSRIKRDLCDFHTTMTVTRKKGNYSMIYLIVCFIVQCVCVGAGETVQQFRLNIHFPYNVGKHRWTFFVVSVNDELLMMFTNLNWKWCSLFRFLCP